MSEQRDAAGFLYQIGDTLTHRGLPAGENGKAGFRLFVLERMYEECPGGSLRRYCCRVISANDGKVDLYGRCQHFDEVELCPLPVEEEEMPAEFRPLAANLGLAYRYALGEINRLRAEADLDGAAAMRKQIDRFKTKLLSAAKELEDGE